MSPRGHGTPISQLLPGHADPVKGYNEQRMSSHAHTRGWASPGRPKPLPQALKASALERWPLGAPRAAPEGLHLREADSLRNFGHEGEVNTNNFDSVF
ncbi:hypothetical protein CROQUDRAFT_90799 [Cronartium quercuum f. sp. fusiforme G11]|uniref:Uncharacterized protein n=1 Tax=Cronartium quercuum f. sp. fusiforme G11 TaxID=708437 RepID=A0A9P6NR64_9BASI|nr:hypothetical protein CROQUDRAFT_90799 [Cronartium quercuum f. sp. fusiforme G11]